MTTLISRIAAISGVTNAQIVNGALVLELVCAAFPLRNIDRELADVMLDDLLLENRVIDALLAHNPTTFYKLDIDVVVHGDTATATISAAVERPTPFPICRCTRCKGTGEFSFNPEDGSVCYQCGGVGYVTRYKTRPTDRFETVRIAYVGYARIDGKAVRLGDGATGTFVVENGHETVVLDNDEDTLHVSAPSRAEIAAWEAQQQ
jgi:hypothetical protein